MILPDVNVLVYAFRREADEHERYAAWLSELVAGSDELALHDVPLIAMVRIVTNRRIVPTPAPISTALEFVARVIEARRARWLPSSRATWTALGELAGHDRRLTGSLVPDAHMAALAIAHGCRLATADRGFARFAGLDFFDPTA